MKNFYIHSMGCKSNQFEGSIIIENLLDNGFILSDSIEDSDIFILNSCSVTHKSDNEAMYLLRNAKNRNKNILNVITGCVAQIEKEKLLESNFIDCVVGNDEKLNISSIIKSLISGKKECVAGNIMEQKEFNPVILKNFLKTRISIKIQDGCDNRCTYCIIPFARGKSRSADANFIKEQIGKYTKAGFKEVVLTGIHIGQWGKDKGLKLTDLIKEIEKTSIKRYRLGSLNPLEIDNELLEILEKSEKFCPHFHLSLQSACDKTLKSMNRFYKTEDYLKQIEDIKNRFNHPFIGSDIITGFAGETEEDFNTTVENLKKSGLTEIHTFPYSIRKGTKGALLEDQVPENIRQSRAEIVKEISKQKHQNFLKENLGEVHEVLIEKLPDKNSGFLKGVTKNYIKVLLNSKDINLTNTLCNAKIVKIVGNKVFAEII